MDPGGRSFLGAARVGEPQTGARLRLRRLVDPRTVDPVAVSILCCLGSTTGIACPPKTLP